MSTSGVNPMRSHLMQYDSMEPTITSNNDVICDNSYYLKNPVQRWDVVVFLHARDASKPHTDLGRFMKRVIGLPGETIQFTADGVLINGKKIQVPTLLADRFSSFKIFPEHKYGAQPFQIPADTVFVIGDNPRIYVSDSREFGPVPRRNIEGRVLASVHTTPVV